MAHTKGPWVIIPREIMEDGSVFPRHIVASEREGFVCYLESPVVADIAVKQPGTYWDTNQKKEDTACLIAAAPELLENLIGCMEALASHVPDCIEVQCARAAIAKAQGGKSDAA